MCGGSGATVTRPRQAYAAPIVLFVARAPGGGRLIKQPNVEGFQRLGSVAVCMALEAGGRAMKMARFFTDAFSSGAVRI